MITLRSRPPRKCECAFTLIELLVVIGIIAITAVLLVPALGPASARKLDGATRQFAADLERARLMAIAERTRTRVLLPSAEANFSGAASSPRPWPADIPLRGYVVTSQKKTETVWRQRGQWSRFPDGVAVDPIPGVFVQPSPTPSPTPAIPIDVGGTGATTYTFSGPYIEFLANGSSNLDPAASPAPAAVIADGFVEADGNFKKKSASLRFIVSVDPLTGAVSVK